MRADRLAAGEDSTEETELSDLERAIETVVRTCMEVQEGERVLIVCDSETRHLGEALEREAHRAGAAAELREIPIPPSHGAEPPDGVAEAMREAGVVLAPTTRSLSHTVARRRATEAGARIATLPGVSEEMLARMMGGDLGPVAARSISVAEVLTVATKARITSPSGSDLHLGLEGRTGIADTGQLSAPGAFGNLPCGEGYIAPVEGTAEGTLVVHGSIATFGRIPEADPVSLLVRGGHLVEASGGGGIGARLLAELRRHGEAATNVAELGIGTNDRAILTGNILEDEKILGTAHVAFGASAAIGGAVQVPVHLDCVLLHVNVDIDGNRIVEGGKLLV